MPDHLVPPHGGKLVSLMANPDHIPELRRVSRSWRAWDLTDRQRCDLELLLSGAYSPLRGFMTRKDYESVCGRLRLYNGVLWPIPVILDVTEEFAQALEVGHPLALRDAERGVLAYIDVEEKWKPDRMAEADSLFSSTDRRHPGVQAVLERTHPWYIGGRVVGIEPPGHEDFQELRHTPAELRRWFTRMGWQKIAGYHPPAAMHRGQFELTRRVMRELEACLLIQPAVGGSGAGVAEHFSRIRSLQAVLAHYPAGTAALSLLPLVERRAGPREALWQAILRKNYGCSHFVLEPDQAGAGRDANGVPYYGESEAQELAARHAEELGITVVPGKKMVYVEDLDGYRSADEVPTVLRGLDLSEEEVRRRLAEGRPLPRWFTFPEVGAELARAHPPRFRQGFTVFLIGLPASGKSTIARLLRVRLQETNGRPISLLDGEPSCRHLAAELGTTREHWDANIRRIGYVASEITRVGGIAICTPIAPHEGTRQEVRRMIAPCGGFLLVHVATPLAVCESRDRKGVYARARAGHLQGFPGVSEPFEPAQTADLVLDTTDLAPQEAVQRIILLLQKEGYLGDGQAA